MEKGQSVKFHNDKLPYTVMAVSDKYAVCVRKLNRRADADILRFRVQMGAYTSFTEAYNDCKNEPIYTLIDFEKKIRSSSDLIFFPLNLFNESDCDEAIKMLERGEMGLSKRNQCEFELAK
jgi:hypothetical protein